MNVTLTSLEALILKATNETLSSPDPAAVEAFIAIMSTSTDGYQYGVQALASRIQSLNQKEAILALNMLDQCLQRSDTVFLTEVGKFKFLNELIKLVSPKYYANRTAPEVKTLVLQHFYTWTQEYPNESKFKVAYDMLKNQGVITETPKLLKNYNNESNSRCKQKNPIFEDEEKAKLLQKLLQSKKPEDLQHANRLIKNMVREEERRNELTSRRVQNVSSAIDSAGLLSDMLNHSSEAGPEEEQLIKELHSNCVKIRSTLQQMAETDTNNDSFEEIINAIDILDEVMKEHKAYTNNKAKEDQTNTQTSLLDFAGAPRNGQSSIDVLGDLFKNDNVEAVDSPLPVNVTNNNKNKDVDLLGAEPLKEGGWDELDSLGEQLLKQSLPENAKRAECFNGKNTKKIPMNALEKTSNSNKEQKQDAILDLDFFTKPLPKEHTSIQPHKDDLIVDIISSTSKEIVLAQPLDEKEKLKSLNNIQITLESVKPGNLPPKTVFEEDLGLKTVLHFCRDKPFEGASVFVLSTISKRNVELIDFKIHAVVPKDCKVKMMPPSSTILPVYNPFLPPPAVTQILAIAAPPSRTEINLTLVLSYLCEDETFSEICNVQKLSLL